MTRHHGMFHFAQAIIMQGRYNSVESYGGKNRAKYGWKHRTDCRKGNKICSSADTKSRTSISVEPTSHCQQISSTTYTVSTYASCKWAKNKTQRTKMLLCIKVLLKCMSYYWIFLIQTVRLRCPQSDQVSYDALTTLFFWNCKTPNLSTR